MLTGAEEVDGLIEDRRVHRRVYTDPDVFELELERIWGKAWIFIGHENQVPNPGDFVTTTLGRHPVIMVRDHASRKVQVLLNRCGHRGVKLADRAYGNTKTFKCPYHGWSYRTDGLLAGVPHLQGYDNTGFDIHDRCFQINLIPRVSEHRGFVFASLSPIGPSLRDFLGRTAETIDNMVDRSPTGKVEVVGKVCNKFLHGSNWKTFIENLNDAMHPMVAHAATGSAVRRFKERNNGQSTPEAQIIDPFVANYGWFDQMGVEVLPYGHNFMGGKSSIFSHFNWPAEYLDEMYRFYGKERTEDILSRNRLNTTVYPSLAVRDAIQSIRVIRPISVNEHMLETWVFRLVGAPDALLSRTILYSRLINSSGSLVGPDDLDCYERMQEGLGSDLSDWVDQRRNFGQETITETGNKRAVGTSDLAFRNQYHAWRKYMAGEIWQ